MEAYVPPNREPFLPFGARSGWELLAALESRHGTSIFRYDLRPEKDLITECLALMQKKGYAI